MDIQEIARLHSRYGEAPLTIEMPIEGKTMPMLDGPAGTGASEPRPIWSRLTEPQRLAIALTVVAGIAFPIGMWAASAGKHGGEPRGAKAQVAIVPAAGASAVETHDHEWPSKTQVDARTEPADAPMPPPPQPESQPVLSPVSSAASVSTAAPASASTAPSKPVAKAAPAPAKPAAAVAAGSSPSGAVARAVPQAGETRRSNEIKLF
ncbi:hypothetical protein DFLDMN_006319 (plasmid) [Cupriavidus sp. H19C3]|uniref:hypothetical protein n=1 Tax=Cupriavidus sp. H19C3 TaxID=3241603 RepID=UPI003BF8869C